MKFLVIDSGVDITVGLPVIRTSVDHGAALDIAGKGAIDRDTMIEAIRWAVEMVSRPVAEA